MAPFLIAASDTYSIINNNFINGKNTSSRTNSKILFFSFSEEGREVLASVVTSNN